MKKNGFTFIEILVSVTIISILVAIAVISYGSINKRSRDARRKSDIEQLRSALEMYRADKGYYPNGSSLSFFPIDLVDNSPGRILLDEGYINALPTDPKDNTLYPYKYIMTNPRSGHYYGYCLAAYTESEGSGVNACTQTLPTSYTYGVKNP